MNNVGGLYQTRWETADGYEATLAMNFLGPFTLTSELLPLLQANAPARCLNVVSAAFKMWKPDPSRTSSPLSTAPVQPADLAARSAHDEITERAQVLGPVDDDEAVADPHDL